MAFLDLSWQTFRPEEGYYTGQLDASRPMPIRTFAPIGYEPRYPYPLIVFLHGHGGNEEQIMRLGDRLARPRVPGPESQRCAGLLLGR
jgi:phospholipase/carboxylesterase